MSHERILAGKEDLKKVYADFGLDFPPTPEKLACRYPIIVLIGPPGGGKTEAAKKLSDCFGFEVIPERWEKNPFLTQSYLKTDPEIGFKSQTVMALLKFDNHMRARILARQRPVFVEPSLSTDLAYALTFAELGKMTPGQLVKYLAVYNLLQRLLLPAEADMAISVIPSIEVLLARIKRRGRDYETAFTRSFLEKMSELCHKEEEAWGERCVRLGNMEYVDDTDRQLFREFGRVARGVLVGENPVGFDGAKFLPIEHHGWFDLNLHPDNCDFKLGK